MVDPQTQEVFQYYNMSRLFCFNFCFFLTACCQDSCCIAISIVFQFPAVSLLESKGHVRGPRKRTKDSVVTARWGAIWCIRSHPSEYISSSSFVGESLNNQYNSFPIILPQHSLFSLYILPLLSSSLSTFFPSSVLFLNLTDSRQTSLSPCDTFYQTEP